MFLNRRQCSLYNAIVCHKPGSEVDFVAVSPSSTAYYQVSASTLAEDTLKRELAPLRKISDNYPKYLLTLDEVFGNADYEGIQKKNVLDWLLEELK